MGQVVPSVLTPNVAREVSLLPQFPRNVPAYTLNRACASAAQAITNAADQIRLGHADVVLAGGVESLSDIPVLHSRRFSRLLVEASKAKSLADRLGILAPGAAARPRAGDARHRRALDRRVHGPVGREDGEGERHRPRGAGPPRPAEPPARGRRHRRRPPHRRDRALVRGPRHGRGGRVRQRHPRRHARWSSSPSCARCSTAPTAPSPPATARRSPTAPRWCCSWARTPRAPSAIDRSPTCAATRSPRSIRRGSCSWGPSYAVPKALERAGHRVGATSASSRSTRRSRRRCCRTPQAWASPRWAERLGLPGPVGDVDWARTNVIGGSIAIGHPFGATGARLVTHARQRDAPPRHVQFGLISICAQGGMGSALVLEA